MFRTKEHLFVFGVLKSKNTSENISVNVFGGIYRPKIRRRRRKFSCAAFEIAGHFVRRHSEERSILNVPVKFGRYYGAYAHKPRKTLENQEFFRWVLYCGTKMVRPTRLELVRGYPHAPQTCASANSATVASCCLIETACAIIRGGSGIVNT